MEGNNGEVTNMNNNNNNKQERPEASSLTRRLGSGRAGSGGRLDDASWIQTRESRSRDPGLLHTLQRDKSTPKRLSTGSDDSGWIKATPSSVTRRSTGSDDLWLRSPQRIRRVTTDSWSSSGSGSGASGAAVGAASEAGSVTRGGASGASSGAASSVVNRWNASILEPGKLRIKAEDAKSWIKSDIKDARSGTGRLQHYPEPIRAIHTSDLALRSSDTQPVREAKLRPSDMGDVKLRMQSFEQGFLQSDSVVRAREQSRDRDRSRDREENFTPRAEILKSAIAKFDMVSGSSNKNNNKPETDEDSNWKYERRLRTVRTHRKREGDVCGDDKDGLKVAEDENRGETDRSRDDQGAIRKEDVTVITDVNQGDPNNGEIENISVPHERSNLTAAREPQEEGVLSTLEGTSRLGRRRRRHDPPTEREERMPIKEARMRGHDGGGIEVDDSIKRQEGALTVTDSSTVTHQDSTVKGVDTVTVTDSITTIENTDSLGTEPQSGPTSRQDTTQTGATVKELQTTREENPENKENDFVPTEETYTAQGSITLSPASPIIPHTDTVTLKNREAVKEGKSASNDEGEKVARQEETAAMGEDDAAIEDNGIEENEATKDTNVQLAIQSTTTEREQIAVIGHESVHRERPTEHVTEDSEPDQEHGVEGDRITSQVDIRDVEVTETKTEDDKADLTSEVQLTEEEVYNEAEVTEAEAPGGDGTTAADVRQDQEVIVTEVTCISHTETRDKVDSVRGEDDIVTDTTQCNVTNDTESTVTNDIKNGVTHDIDSSVTNDLEDVSDIMEETLQASTVDLTQSTPKSDITETVSKAEDRVLETEAIVIEVHGEGAGEVKHTLHHTDTDTDTQTTSVLYSGYTQGGDVHGRDDRRAVTSGHGNHGNGDHGNGDHGNGNHGNGDHGDQNESVCSIVTEDIKYVTDDSDSNEETTDKDSILTTRTVSQQVVQGQNLHEISEKSHSGKEKDVIHVQVLEESTGREVIEREIEPKAQEDLLSKSEVPVSDTDTGCIQEPLELVVNQEEQSPRASSNKTNESTLFNDEDINLVEHTAAQQRSVNQEEEESPTKEECDNDQEYTDTRDTMITTETIQLKYDGKPEEESAIKIIVTQVKDIRGESDEEVESDSRACVGECRETEELTEEVTVRGSGDVLHEGNNDFNADKMTHTAPSAERLAGSAASGSAAIISLAQADMTSAGECTDQTESEVTRRVENEPNGEYRDHYHVGGETGDNTCRAEEEDTSKATQAEQSIQIPSQEQSIEITHESRGIDKSSSDLTIGAKPDQDAADPSDEKSVSYVCEDYMYVDTPHAHSDSREAQGHHQTAHDSKCSPGSFGSQHEMERSGFDVNEDDDNCTEQEPEAVNVENSLVGSVQKPTQSGRGDTEEHTERGVEEGMTSSQHYTKPDDTNDNPTHSEDTTEEQTDYAEADRALLSQGYSRLEDEDDGDYDDEDDDDDDDDGDDDDDDDTAGRTQVMYMDDVELPSEDSNSEGGEYAENDTEEETLDSEEEQEDTDSDGSSERIEYPWGVERAWGLETIQERPEGFDSDREEEKRAPLAQMDSSDDDEEWIEEYTFIHHEPEESQPERSEEQLVDKSEEIRLITTAAEPRVDTEEGITATEDIPEVLVEERSHKMEYIDESLQEEIIQEEDIQKHQCHSESATSGDIEEQAIEEGFTEQNESDDIPQLSQSLSSQQVTTRDSNTGLTSSEEDQDLDEEKDHDSVDGAVSSSLHLMKNLNTREEIESSEKEAMKTEIEISLTSQTDQDKNNNQTSGDVAKSDDEVVTEVAEVMSLAVLSEAILSLHSSPQEPTETSAVEEALVSEVIQQSDPPSGQDDHLSKSTNESVTAIAEAISSVAISEAILSLPREKPTHEETHSEDITETVSLSEAQTVQETSHGGISEKSDGADNMPEEMAEAVSDMIISEASIAVQSSPMVEDGTADDDVSSADSERDSDSDSDGDESSEGDPQRPATINDATLGVIAEYMSSEVMSEVLVSLQSRLEELEDEESEAMESHSLETEVVVAELEHQDERVGEATDEELDESSEGTVDTISVEDIAEGMSLAVITETMATLQQTAPDDSSENVSEDSNDTTQNTPDNELHSESTSDHSHSPHVEDRAPSTDSSEPGEMNVESADTSTQEAEQEACVAVATIDVVGSTIETVEISETVSVRKEPDVRSVSDPPSSTESAKNDAVNATEQVQEISQTVQEGMVAPSSEPESCHEDQTVVTMATSEVTSEGQTKDSVLSTSQVSPSKTDPGPNDDEPVEGVINAGTAAVKVAHSDSSQQDSGVNTTVKNTESQSETDAISDVKSKMATKVISTEESAARKVHIKDVNVQPELSKRERTRLLRETRSRLSRTVTNKEQERSEDTARYRRPRKPPPTEEQLQMKQLVTWLSCSPARTGDTKHTKMLNGDDDVCYDTLILEVFEESETIFFPLVQQKEARAFIKALHMKGVTYESLCQEVGEHEHNFTSWRKSLGRAGIGHAVMQWANRPLQDLLDDEEEEDEDDGMDDAEAEQERKEEEDRLREEEGQRRLQGSIDSDKVKKEVDHNKNDQKDAHDQNNSSTAKSNGVTMRRPKETSPPPIQTKMASDGKPPRQKYEQEPDLIRLRRLQEFKKTQEKGDAEPIQDIRKRISLFEKQQSPSKSGSESREESENGEPEEESRTETESISSGSMDEPTESSPEPPSEPRPASPEPPLVVEEEVVTVQQEAVVEEAPYHATSNGRSTREATPKDTSPPPVPADDNKPKDHTDSSGSSVPDVNENYNSDLDPDNDMHSPVQAIAAKKIASSRINKTWSGFIFVFSDTPANSDTCRVKVGASAFPHKRLRQAQLFNPDMYQVHTVAVKQRAAALEQVLAELDPYRLPGQKDWFEGPFNDLLAAISDVAARFPSSRKIIDNNADDGDGESAC